MRFYPNSGFAAEGSTPPSPDAPLDWLAWHFTTWANLERVIAAGRLNCDRSVETPEAVGDSNIKASRLKRQVMPVGNAAYPSGVAVGDHVPFYFTPRSPALYRVVRGGTDYRGDHTGLVMLGVSLRTIDTARLTWCVSDRNAAASIARFTSDGTNLGSFVDFELMQAWNWNNIPADSDRQTRRAAELLILGSVPLSVITHVVTSTEQGRAQARRMLETNGGTRQYDVHPSFLYDDRPHGR
jgi:hypothetical protein